MSTRAKTTLLALAMLTVGFVLPASAHPTYTPNLDCTPAQAVHDFVGFGSIDATALQETTGAGATIVFESSINCPDVPICTEDIVVDDGGTPEDPSDDIVIPCEPPLSDIMIPGSDNDFEWGVGGALLPDDHHTGDDGLVAWKICKFKAETIIGKFAYGCIWTGQKPFGTGGPGGDDTFQGSAVAGRDGNDDGITDGGDDPTDCLSDPLPGVFDGEIHDATDDRLCDATGAAGGLDTGTWVFSGVHINTGDDGSFGEPGSIIFGGPILGLVDGIIVCVDAFLAGVPPGNPVALVDCLVAATGAAVAAVQACVAQFLIDGDVAGLIACLLVAITLPGAPTPPTTASPSISGGFVAHAG